MPRPKKKPTTLSERFLAALDALGEIDWEESTIDLLGLGFGGEFAVDLKKLPNPVEVVFEDGPSVAYVAWREGPENPVFWITDEWECELVAGNENDLAELLLWAGPHLDSGVSFSSPGEAPAALQKLRAGLDAKTRGRLDKVREKMGLPPLDVHALAERVVAARKKHGKVNLFKPQAVPTKPNETWAWLVKAGMTKKTSTILTINRDTVPGAKLKAVPDEICELTNLEELNIEGLGIESLPESIGQLKSLRILRLPENKLTSLPETLASLPKLQELVLRHNKLKVVPPVAARLTGLTSLDLDDNRLTTVPAELGALTQLVSISLNDNRLKDLPASFSSLTALQYVDIAGNLFEEVPAALIPLSRIRTLRMFGTRSLKRLQPAVAGMRSLKFLQLDHTGLTEWPAVLEELPGLESLEIFDCKLREIPPTIARMESLERLLISDCELKSLPQELLELKKLRKIGVSGNGIPDKHPVLLALKKRKVEFRL